MKNIRCLDKTETKEFISNLFESPLFIQNLNNPEISKVIEDFCKFPRFIGEYSNQTIEHAHFYSWFNILILREYDNKFIQDLYYLHELKHITSMSYDSKLNFEQWKDKMIQNELESALLSEVMIYDIIPGLREKTFPFAIWYDEVNSDIRKDLSLLKQDRKRAMIQPQSEVEKVLYRYNLSNDIWAEVWRSNYQKIEKHMQEFYETLNTDQFLINFNIDVARDQIIFEDEAHKFTESYLRLKKETNT